MRRGSQALPALAPKIVVFLGHSWLDISLSHLKGQSRYDFLRAIFLTGNKLDSCCVIS
jgi:hypothetical protein